MSYKTEYKKVKRYSLGGRWCYLVMEIEDNNGRSKVRLSKCKINRSNIKNGEKGSWDEINPNEIDGYSQVQRMNFKRMDELNEVVETLKEFLGDLNE